jgi:CRP/FNR family transcriptional regulator, cyclic AMP receptor protein
MYREVQNHWRGKWTELLGSGRETVHIPAGERLFRTGQTPLVVVVDTGVVRVFTRIASGRQMTLRYAREGDLLGLAHLLGFMPSWDAEAATDATVQLFGLDEIRSAITRDADLSWKMVEHMAAWAAESVRNLAEVGAQTMAARVATHIKAIALPAADGSLVARVSHQRLAEAVGTAREVITREVRRLRSQGVVAAEPGLLIIVDARQLESIAAGGDAGPRSL